MGSIQPLAEQLQELSILLWRVYVNISEHIMYEDEAVIVCYKTAGVPTQSNRVGEQDMGSLLRNYLAVKGETPYIGFVHRLDQPVEGVMVFAKTKEAAAALSRQMQEKGFGKYYYAVVCGTIPETEGTLSNYLLRDGRSNTSSVVKEQTPGAKRAILHYEVLAREEQPAKSLIRVRLETGRHHQIRVQFAHAGYPLSGDRKYNQTGEKMQGNIALCSYRIEFAHPITEKRLVYEIVPRGLGFSDFVKNGGISEEIGIE